MKAMWRIIVYSRSLWRYYAAIGVFTVGLSVASLLQPLLSGKAIDEISKGSAADVRYVLVIAAVIFALELFSTMFSNIGGYLGDQMHARLQKLLSERYYQHLLSLPQRYFDTELSGKILNRLNRSITQISNFMHMMSNNFLQFIFTTVFSLIVVAIYSWHVAVMLLLLYPIYIYMTFRTSNKWQKYQAQKNKHTDIATGRFAEAVGQIRVVKSFNQEKRELSFFSSHLRKVVKIERPQSMYWHRRDVERRLVLNVIFFAVYAYIFVQGARGVFTPGASVALILYAMQIRIPIFTISFLVENTQKAIADSKDYFEAMSIVPEIADKSNAITLRTSEGEIDLQHVSFGYDHTPVLKDISLHIAPGTKTALVGESGEGKTTLTNLLIRLYEPQSGTIRIDGQDIAEATQVSLREAISVVFQEPALFSGTVYENIAYARPGATEAEVVAAAKAAYAHDFVQKFERGYQTQIGERGLKLSGGQKQRIAIARALLKDAPILILDEATSSLDSKSEAEVQSALERLMKGRTTIIIAHRLTTIAAVDTIVTLRNGRIDEVGTPSELMKTHGIYAQLLQMSARHTTQSKKRLQAFEISA